MENNCSYIDAFFLLVRVGLFGRTEGAEVLLLEGVDWAEVYQLAKEQSVVGLIVEGLETLQSRSGNQGGLSHTVWQIPGEVTFQLAGETLYLERSNLEMNKFVAKLIGRLRKHGIYALLLKGQGVAQCYEKPLWRACGDVDLLLNANNYQKAKDYLTAYARNVGPEHPYKKHMALSIGNWVVELHGHLRCGFSSRVDRVLDAICSDTFCSGSVTSWTNQQVEVFTFFMHNVFGRKSKMFIGDGGTMMIGFLMTIFVLGALSLRRGEWLEAQGVGVVAMTLAVLCIPVFDTLRVMTVRMLRGCSPFRPDKSHLHHLFIDMGFSHLAASIVILSMNFTVIVVWLLLWLAGASVNVQTWIVALMGMAVTFGFYKLMRWQQHSGPIGDDGHPQGTLLWQTACKIGRWSHVEEGRGWHFMQTMVDGRWLKRHRRRFNPK